MTNLQHIIELEKMGVNGSFQNSVNARMQQSRARENALSKAKNKFCRLYGNTPANRRCFNKHFKVKFINGKFQTVMIDYFGLI